MSYVIGIDGGSAKCVIKAKDMQGRPLAERTGNTTNHQITGVRQAGRRVAELVEALLSDFGGRKEDCRSGDRNRRAPQTKKL